MEVAVLAWTLVGETVRRAREPRRYEWNEIEGRARGSDRGSMSRRLFYSVIVDTVKMLLVK